MVFKIIVLCDILQVEDLNMYNKVRYEGLINNMNKLSLFTPFGQYNQ